jgi:hypothetical protein
MHYSHAATAVRLLREMSLAIGIAVGTEELAKITEIWLTRLGPSWPIQ